MILLLCLFILDKPDVEPQKAWLTPYRIENEADSRTYLRGVAQIEIDRDLMYLRQSNAAEILVFTQSKVFAFAIGRRGHGPGEFPANIKGMSVSDGAVFAVRDREKAYYYEGPTYEQELPLKGFGFTYGTVDSNVFAFDQDHVVVQAYPSTRALALAYGFDGTVVEKIGKIFKIDREALMKNPAYNDTIWVKGGKHWFGLFKYHPLIQKFDQNFKPVAEFTYSVPAMEDYRKRWEDFKAKKKFRIPMPLNTDIKFHDGKVWIMCHGTLLALNANSGKAIGLWHFFGKGVGFEHVLNTRLYLYSFDFFSNGEIVMGSFGESWGSQLWTSILEQNSERGYQ